MLPYELSDLRGVMGVSNLMNHRINPQQQDAADKQPIQLLQKQSRCKPARPT
jgi:hypothetical protein